MASETLFAWCHTFLAVQGAPPLQGNVSVTVSKSKALVVRVSEKTLPWVLTEDQSFFTNGVLGVFQDNIFYGLFTEDIRGLMLQKLLQCWDCSLFLALFPKTISAVARISASTDRVVTSVTRPTFGYFSGAVSGTATGMSSSMGA